MGGRASITTILSLYAAAVYCCTRVVYITESTNNKGLRPPHGEDLYFDPNASTLFPKRYTKRTPEPENINGPKPGHPKWEKGWGPPEGQKTPWGGGGKNPTTPDGDAEPGADYDPNYPYGFYYDEFGNKIAAQPGQDTYIDADGNIKPIRGKKNEFPHGYYYDENGNKVAAKEGQETYVDANGRTLPVRGIPDPFPHGYFYDEDGNKVAAKEGQDYYFDADGNKKPVRKDFYPDGYYYDKDGNKIPAKPGQEFYYDEDGNKKPIIQDHGYYFDKDGNRVPAKPGQEFYYDANGIKKPIRGKPPKKENPNPWADDERVPDSWKVVTMEKERPVAKRRRVERSSSEDSFSPDRSRSRSSRRHSRRRRESRREKRARRRRQSRSRSRCQRESRSRSRRRPEGERLRQRDGKSQGRPPGGDQTPPAADRIPRLGPGFGGDPPPPWAWVPANYGKPAYCFQPPSKGKCTEIVKRFAYNPFNDECVQFPYSGCGGNGNNFLTKERCEEECTKLPEPDCDPLAYDAVNVGNYMDVGRRCLR